jgi:hypothetical protein
MRSPLFKLSENPEVLRFVTKPGDSAKNKVLRDVIDFFTYSEQLTNKQHVNSFIEKLLARCIYQVKISGHSLYSLLVAIKNNNPGPLGEEWYKQADRVYSFAESTLAWVRMSRAACNYHRHPESNPEEIASKWEVSVFELKQLNRWFIERGINHFGESEAKERWYGDICNEEDRFQDLTNEYLKHAGSKLALPSFSYLCDIYEDRMVLVHQLLERAWIAVICTAHLPQVESLKLGKTYISKGLFHLAKLYTSTNKKQQWNEELQTFEIMELAFLNDPERDESKHDCLRQMDQGFEEVELNHLLDESLSPRHLDVVHAILGQKVNPSFEKFAETKADRRLAAFEFFKVSESELRESILPLLGREDYVCVGCD